MKYIECCFCNKPIKLNPLHSIVGKYSYDASCKNCNINLTYNKNLSITEALKSTNKYTIRLGTTGLDDEQQYTVVSEKNEKFMESTGYMLNRPVYTFKFFNKKIFTLNDQELDEKINTIKLLL